MKLLSDENLSPKLPRLLADLFPNFHVRDVGMKATDDPIVWGYAKDNNFMIVSKDADMHDLLSVRESAESCLATAWKLLNTTGRRTVAPRF